MTMSIDTWLIFLATSVGLSLSPGPNGLLALTHGALHGRRKAVCTVAGGAIGFVALIGLSLFGVGALLERSLVWLTIMKWIGGLYLIWLGIQIWRSPPMGTELDAQAPRLVHCGALFRQGLLSAMTNPKGILFFAAFLPQFIDPASSLLLQFAVMAGTFAAVEVTVELFLASMAQRIRPWIKRTGKRLNQLCAGAFVAVGALLPLRH